MASSSRAKSTIASTSDKWALTVGLAGHRLALGRWECLVEHCSDAFAVDSRGAASCDQSSHVLARDDEDVVDPSQAAEQGKVAVDETQDHVNRNSSSVRQEVWFSGGSLRNYATLASLPLPHSSSIRA